MKERYIKAMKILISKRIEAGGTLSDEEESKSVSELNDLWFSLTDIEQDEVEDYFAAALQIKSILDDLLKKDTPIEQCYI